MKQGTTPEFIFELPFDTEIVKTAKVTFVTNVGSKIEKKHDECTIEGNRITVKLSQKDTFELDCMSPIRVQLRILTKDGEALASDIFQTHLGKCLDNEVLT